MPVTASDPVHRLAELPAFTRACASIHRADALTLEDQCTIARIPAPPFGERERGEWIRLAFVSLGLAGVQLDPEGNVMGVLEGTEPELPPVIIAAHLDTVFPAGTPLDLQTDGARLSLPGIADNARGLAGLLALIRVIGEAHITPVQNVIFVATVGEEGVGDLRGVKYLFREGSRFRRASAFIALDGTETRRIVTRGVGSRRYRVVLNGPGGHSWADRGTPNPAHSLGSAIAELARIRLPDQPAWALNVGRVGGGTSINAIPEEAWLELDLRSDDPDVLGMLETRALQAIDKAVLESNSERRRGALAGRAEITMIGERPAGATPADAPVVQAARSATRFIGRRPELVSSSTDANVPMALGIPAIAIGAGGESGGTHTLHEWFENRRGPEGIVRALLILLATAGAAR
jgi:acetylornithine deacetylase/succinyl-diaminopimelate desuccinylase-like protein